MRITENDLRAVIERLNKITNNNPAPYTRTDNGLVANVGNYHLDCAYGGYNLAQMVNEGGGIRNTFGCGYVPKKELYGLIHAYIRGIETQLS